jgi:membrane protein
MFRTRNGVLAKFFADRGTHLAAMIAYFALLAFVPLMFLALSLLGLTGRADETSFLVTEIKRAFPETRIEDIVRLVQTVQQNAASLGLIGAAFLLWTSLGLFSALESALNIVYGRPNRSFLQGKLVAVLLMLGSLITLFVALLAGSFGVQALRRYAPGFIDNDVIAYSLSVLVSTAGVFVFIVSIYYLLTNVQLKLREVLFGAAFATVLLESSFQALPVFVRYAELNPALKTFGSPVILLVWLYVMSNVIVLGAELNWWRYQRRQPEAEEAQGLA